MLAMGIFSSCSSLVEGLPDAPVVPADPPAPSSDMIRIAVAATVSSADAPFALRAAGIMARQIRQRCNATVSLPSTTGEVTQASDAPLTIQLAILKSVGEEGFSIADSGLVTSGGEISTTVIISGGDIRGLLFGAGKFLRSSRFDGPASGPFIAGSWRGTDAPRLRNSFRAAYFAVHYNNFYAAAPVDALTTYIEDIALWGVNTLVVLLPGPSSYANGERTTAPDAPQIPLLKNHTRILLQLASDIGVSPAVIIVPNQGFDNGTDAHRQGHSPIPYTPFPDPEGVRGNLGALTCPFKGHDYLLDIIGTELGWYQDIGLDWLVFWPYLLRPIHSYNIVSLCLCVSDSLCLCASVPLSGPCANTYSAEQV